MWDSHSNQTSRKGSMWNTGDLILPLYFEDQRNISILPTRHSHPLVSYLPTGEWSKFLGFSCHYHRLKWCNNNSKEGCPPCINSLISFKVCFVGSHWRHSKELVTCGLKSFTTNCVNKFFKHVCPLLILFCQHPIQAKIAALHGPWFIFHFENRK